MATAPAAAGQGCGASLELADSIGTSPAAGIIRLLSTLEADIVLGNAWWGGKNRGSKRIDHGYTSNDDGSGWIEAYVPLFKVKPNEAGDLYDGTSNPDRVAAYTSQRIETPVHLLYSERALRKGIRHAAVMDGGHRVSAARKRGDATIRAVMQLSHFERLMD